MKEELFESILKEADGFTIGNTTVLPTPEPSSSQAKLSYTRPNVDAKHGYYAIIKYIVEHPFCKRREILDNLWHEYVSRGQWSSVFKALHYDGFFRITNKWEYIPTGKAVDFIAKHEGREIINPSEEEIEDHEADEEE